jgi:hypothetical protein
MTLKFRLMLFNATFLDLQLPVQSVPIITNIVSSNPVHGEVTTLCDKSLRVTSTGRWFSLDTLTF